MYKGSFDNWDDVREEFSDGPWGNKLETSNVPAEEPAGLIIAVYEQECYEGSADVLYKNDDGTYTYVRGGHCSCYGLGGQWDPEIYTKEQLLGQVERATYGFFKDEKELIESAIGD